MEDRKQKEGDDVAPPVKKKLKPNEEDDEQDPRHTAKDPISAAPQPLPPELQSVDFSKRISWGKYHPYTEKPLPIVPEENSACNIEFTEWSPALTFQIHAVSGRARASTMHLKPQQGQQEATNSSSRPVPTPMFMPVGTKGCLKALTFHELTSDPALSCPIILANTYHLAIQPGTELINEMGGLHSFQGLPNVLNDNKGSSNNNNNESPSHHHRSYNLLTDSGGFQMVSLVKLSKVTEDGVSFENPYKQQQQKPQQQSSGDTAVATTTEAKIRSTKENDDNNNINNMLLLKPEDSIRHQNKIGANIIMALDDVVSSVADNPERFVTATHRTLRWYDRCYAAHAKKQTQNLFPIVQGGLDVSLGGLREQCLAGFRRRQEQLQYITPGYAIGGLAGGESKDAFWKVIDCCCRALPDDKPRYLMGVGYPLDLVVCTALGVDMYDCVYPTRTARFGVALVPGKAPGTLKVRGNDCALDTAILQTGCNCQACRNGISRSRLHRLLKANNPVAVELITQHNIASMMSLVRNMREAILQDRYAAYATEFVKEKYPGEQHGGEAVPSWVADALNAAGISL